MADQSDIKDIYNAWFAAVAEFNENKGFLKFARQTVHAAHVVDKLFDFRLINSSENLTKFRTALKSFSDYLDETAGNLDPTNPGIISPARLIENAERIFFQNARKRDVVAALGTILNIMLVSAERMIQRGIIENPVKPPGRFWSGGLQNDIGWSIRASAERFGIDLRR